VSNASNDLSNTIRPLRLDARVGFCRPFGLHQRTHGERDGTRDHAELPFHARTDKFTRNDGCVTRVSLLVAKLKLNLLATDAATLVDVVRVDPCTDLDKIADQLLGPDSGVTTPTVIASRATPLRSMCDNGTTRLPAAAAAPAVRRAILVISSPSRFLFKLPAVILD